MAARSLFSIVAMTKLGEVAGRKTEQCLINPRFYGFRDVKFDKWLPVIQPKADACLVATLALQKNTTFAKLAATILGIPSRDTSAEAFAKTLKSEGYIMTLPQIEEMVKETERSYTGIQTENLGNFCLVNGNNGDCIIAHFHHIKMWNTHAWDPKSLDNNCNFFAAGSRFLVLTNLHAPIPVK